MKEQHTPAPWGYTYTSSAEARRKARAEAKANGTCPTDGGGASGLIQGPPHHEPYYGLVRTTIAFAPHNRDPKRDAEGLANMRLMAAAPELLAALVQLLGDYSHYAPTGAELGGPYADECRVKAKDAIAKATKP